MRLDFYLLYFVGILLFVGGCLAFPFPWTCQYPCRCPKQELSCPAGVSTVEDGCGCCFMCARQHGDMCNVKDKCDKKRGLYCDSDVGNGICRAYASRPCMVNGKTYADGQKFQPECSRMCTCQNGNYGCVDLCPEEHRQPSLAHCQQPRLMEVAGQCCKQWTCEVKQRADTGGKSPRHTMHQSQNLIVKSSSYQARFAPLKYQNTQPNCDVNTTDWSPCSVSCGTGISTRYVKKNCKRVEETMLCYLRQCGPTVYSEDFHKCTPTTRVKEKKRLQYQDCRSVREHRLKLCTTCKRNRCCYPRRYRLRHIEFECDGGDRQLFKFMWLKSCRCDRECYKEDHDDRIWTA